MRFAWPIRSVDMSDRVITCLRSQATGLFALEIVCSGGIITFIDSSSDIITTSTM